MDKTPPERQGSTETAGSPESRSPQSIGPYRILQKVGEGGMGEVYEAEQERPVCRRVALKVIKHGMDTEQVVARFEAERQALALMNHPNIAKVFDAGATEQGRPYFVMEYVKGVPITEHCDRHRLNNRERLELFQQICEGVQHAHQKAIIHRDLKPSNVLVTEHDGKRLPKIIDFGVAKATAQKLTEKTMFTALGVLIGTPEYMSPEQADLTGEDVDTRTDVYSLGVILYELLVGALPIDSKELRGGGFEGMRKQIREQELHKPSTRLSTLGDRSTESAKCRRVDLPTLQRQLRGDLDWITMRALEKDRSRRYGSPMDLAADIERHLKHEPVLASPPSTAYRMQKFVRRHRLGVVAGSVVIVALVAGSTLATIGMARAVRAERSTKQEAETAKQVSDFLVELFEVSDPGESRGNTITARELLDQGAERIDRELADQPLVQAQMMDTMGRVYRSLGLYNESEPLLETALDIRRRELGERDPVTARSLYELAWLKQDAGRPDEAAPLAEQALRLQEELLGPDSLEAAWSRYRLGAILAEAGALERSRVLLASALAVFERTLGPNSLAVAWCLNDLGVGFVQSGDLDEALSHVERAVTIKERILGPDHWDVAMGRNNVAYVLAQLGRYEEAQTQLEEVLRSQRKSLGTKHPTYAITMHSLGEVLLQAGQRKEAKEILARALSVQQETLEPTAPQVALTLHTLADAHQALGEYADAERCYRGALTIREALPPDHPDLTATLRGLASLLRETGRQPEAEALEARARTTHE